MLTTRGRWLVVLAVCGLVPGLLRGQTLLTLSCLSVLIWIFFEWMLFRWRVELKAPHLRCTRLVNGSARRRGTVFVGQALHVSVRIQSSRPIYLPFVRFEDWLPENARVDGDDNSLDASMSGGNSVEIRYTAWPHAAGSIELHGVTAHFCDLQGLFFSQRFLPFKQSYRVLPTCVEVDASRPTVKRVNALPPPGIHRLRQAGMGAELLELREYVTGDPPRSIAWKVSARRDCLMTRQYESEVPVRTILFLDNSFGTRIGSYGFRPLDQLLFLGASVARSAMAVRDPVGLTLFDDSHSRHVQTGTGDRHFYRLLDEMTVCSTETDPPPVRLTDRLLDLSLKVCHERYPHLLDPRVNRLPFTFFPLLPGRRRRRNQRARLAAILTELYGLSPKALLQLVHDDLMMATQLQRLLIEQGFSWTQPVVDRRSREIHDWHGKFDTLTDAITRTVAHGRDNELYVLLVDLIDYTGPLGRLAQAIRVARARHHRVVVICAWPDQHPPMTEDEPAESGSVKDLLEQAERYRLNAAAARLRREIRRLGASIAFAGNWRPVRLVLAEAEIARHGRTSLTRI